MMKRAEKRAEVATSRITENDFNTAATTQATASGYEIYTELCTDYAIPIGTRSIGYLTKLLKPTFHPRNCEDSFSD